MSWPSPRALVAASAFLFTALAAPAAAQPTFESAGIRALGMGGAFVAVADDASATHWNPAGLVGGGPAGATVGWLRSRSGRPGGEPRSGVWKAASSLTSLGTWPLGLSYGTYSLVRIDDVSGGEAMVTSLRTSQFGVTILQSVVQGLVVGSTLRYIRGDVVHETTGGLTVGDALDAMDDLEGRRSGAFDLDLSLMADMQRVRIGATWKNLRTPTFGDVAESQITLPRQTRLGLAILPTNGLTLALDMDLNTVDLLGEPRRMAAAGGEARLGSRLVARTGVRWSVEGARRVTGSAGVSVAVRPGLWLDGLYMQGAGGEDRELGIALRAGR